MEKSTDTKFHAGSSNPVSNVIPFPVREQTVEVLVCSHCESKDFMLVDNTTNEICCSGCGYVISNKWEHLNDV